MNELEGKIDWMLFEIHKKGWLSLSKDDSEITFNAKTELAAYGLIERQSQHSWKLTREGFEAVKLGGYAQWRESQKKVTTDNASIRVNAENVSIVNGDKNSVKQSNKSLKKTKEDSTLKKIVIGVVISLISAAIIYFLANYSSSKTELQNTKQSSKIESGNSDSPPVVDFVNGEKGTIYYSIQIELIDTLIIQTAEKFGDQAKAVSYLKERARNELISSLEKTKLSFARKNRDSLSKEIVAKTLNDQFYSGHKIISLNINEIKTGANTK
ncbi:hypothetical protein Q4534_14150 [Cyclobacterium sp. 1_MG-2023]|uniref:hypothetical protein n=1 Tax=Cyclobacterium sp. 1_MG-2023 TaxID=3062681 RepID=UPI0026E26DC9|nr:hypothetical protein [Cyclobacterium sp. 1_MG-2023]MDO6438561.1 hypothetical protein [Cyclobacterium sp. 1_MG-2023]